MNEQLNRQLLALGDVSVTIGLPVDNGIPPKTVMSLVRTAHTCAKMGIRCDLAMEISGVIQIGRDAVLDDFLRGDTQKLFWIDSDMVWNPEDFLRLLALSTRFDVVGAAYPAKVEGPVTFYVNSEDGAKPGEFGLIPVKGLGLGFTVVDRAVVEKLAAASAKVHDQITGREVASVFRVDIVDGHRRTEDMAFFADIRDAGHTVWLDPQISLGHIGDREWRGRMQDALQSAPTESGSSG